MQNNSVPGDLPNHLKTLLKNSQPLNFYKLLQSAIRNTKKASLPHHISPTLFPPKARGKHQSFAAFLRGIVEVVPFRSKMKCAPDKHPCYPVACQQSGTFQAEQDLACDPHLNCCDDRSTLDKKGVCSSGWFYVTKPKPKNILHKSQGLRTL